MHWSDHGPLPRGKRWPYDSGIRMPLIVRGPGADELNETQSVMVQARPTEELYDTEVDPYEVANLANDPTYADELQRL